MKHVAIIALLTLAGAVAEARPASGGVPRLNVEQSCREAQAFGGDDNKLAFKGCMQDENDAFKQLEQNWTRFKLENRSNCLAQGVSPMPSYVEILTCIEMYDSAGTLNRPGLSGGATGSAGAAAGSGPASGTAGAAGAAPAPGR